MGRIKNNICQFGWSQEKHMHSVQTKKRKSIVGRGWWLVRPLDPYVAKTKLVNMKLKTESSNQTNVYVFVVVWLTTYQLTENTEYT